MLSSMAAATTATASVRLHVVETRLELPKTVSMVSAVMYNMLPIIGTHSRLCAWVGQCIRRRGT